MALALATSAGSLLACGDDPMSVTIDAPAFEPFAVASGVQQEGASAIEDGHVHTLAEVAGEDVPGGHLMDPMVVTGLEGTQEPRAETNAEPAVGFSMKNIPEVCNGTRALAYDGSLFHEDDCDVLLFVKDQLRGTATLNWDTAVAVPEWTGVQLETNGVDKLVLPHLGLDGTIPPEPVRSNLNDYMTTN